MNSWISNADLSSNQFLNKFLQKLMYFSNLLRNNTIHLSEKSFNIWGSKQLIIKNYINYYNSSDLSSATEHILSINFNFLPSAGLVVGASFAVLAAPIEVEAVEAGGVVDSGIRVIKIMCMVTNTKLWYLFRF